MSINKRVSSQIRGGINNNTQYSEQLQEEITSKMRSGVDSLNETKLSFAAGLDYNSAVKFNENQKEEEDQPYYTFSTSQRQNNNGFDSSSNHDYNTAQEGNEAQPRNVFKPKEIIPNASIYKDEFLKITVPYIQKPNQKQLPDISFLMTAQQIDSLFDIIVEPDIIEKSQDIRNDMEHYKIALWMLHKLFSQKGLSLKQISMRNQYGLLFKLNQCLRTENPELMLNSLRTLLAFLQKFENGDIPIKDIREVCLIETLHEALEQENELLGEITRLSLSILTSISYQYPTEVSRFNIKKVIRLCDSTCGDLRTQEAAVKLICNLLTNDLSRQDILDNDGLFGIFHCLINNNKASLKYALASILNLTFLTNSKSAQTISKIAINGGIAHLIGALQKSFSLGEYLSMQYAVKSISNLAASSISINIVLGEFGTFDILLQIIKQQSQVTTEEEDQKQNINTLINFCMICIQSLSTINLNKIQLLDKTSFLLAAQQLLSNHQTDINTNKALLQILGRIASEAYQFSKKIQGFENGQLMNEVYKLMMRSKDEGIIRKCMRFYIQMVMSGASLQGVITSNEIQQFNEEKKPLLSMRGEKLLSKFQQAFLKPTQQKKQMVTNEDQLDWNEINQIRKATKSCLTILKDKINNNFEKKKEFDMSFGLGKDHDDDDEDEKFTRHVKQRQDDKPNKFQEYRDEMAKQSHTLLQQREEKLQAINRNDSMRKSRTPQRLNNPKIEQQDEIKSQDVREKIQRNEANRSFVAGKQDNLIPKPQQNKSQSLNQSYRHQTPGPLRPNSKLSANKPNLDNSYAQNQAAKERFNMLEPLAYIPQIKTSQVQGIQDFKNTTVESFNSYQIEQIPQSQTLEVGRPIIKGGPISIHSLNSHGMDSRLNSRQSQNRQQIANNLQYMHQNSQRSQLSVSNIGQPQQQNNIMNASQMNQTFSQYKQQQPTNFEPSQITEENMQPTFDSYYQGSKQSTMQANRIDPFQNKAYPGQMINNQNNQTLQQQNPDQQYVTFAQTFLPQRKREELDIEDQVRLFKSGKTQQRTNQIQVQQIVQRTSYLNLQERQVNQYQQQQNQQQNSYQQDSRKVTLKGSNNIINQQQYQQQQQMVVPYNQQIGQPQQNDQVSLPPLPKIDLDKFIGQEQPLIERFLDVNLIEKDNLESKHARHHLGIGMPEAKALQKKNNVTTVRELVEWYKDYKANYGEQQTHLELQKSICSSQLTVKLIALTILTGAQLGYNLS